MPAQPIQHDEEVVEDESVDDDATLTPPAEPSLSYFGADFDVAGLVRRYEEGDIFVPQYDPDQTEGSTLEGFQRPHVWTAKKMEAFIESLLLGWPVPSIFLVLDTDQRYLVLDGQQRINTLVHFYRGQFPDGKPFVLQDVAENLKFSSFETLTREDRRRLDNTFIQATVIEPRGSDGPDSVYRLFGRLNSGGMSLTPQEIRVALYRGKATDLIRNLNHNPDWRTMFGPPNKRLKDHELILRGLAMLEVVQAIDGNWDDPDRSKAYKPPISEFLNSYLLRHRELSQSDALRLTSAFASACHVLEQAMGTEGLRFTGSINAAHVDAMLAALMDLATRDIHPAPAAIAKAVAALRRSSDYATYVTKSTSHRDSVLGRLRLAVHAISEQ